VAAHIESFFNARKKKCPSRVMIQAQVPDGATVIQNSHGTAPGLVMDTSLKETPDRSSMLVMLPGPPRELKPMFTSQILPLIQNRFPQDIPQAFRVLRSTGLGESMVEEKLHVPLQSLISQGLETGYCARPGEVDVQLLVRGPDAPRILEKAVDIVGKQIGESLFGQDDDQLEEVVIHLLTQQHKTVALAESCTGGYLANRLTNVSGASQVFLAGLVTYSNAAKQTFLGVPAATLEEHGAVSKSTALAMASGARERTGADYALALTGIAGPTGGSDDKPVGTVYIALAGPDFCKVHRFMNPFDRATFKYVTSQQALNWLRQTLLNDRK
jgi:nicotinamide-nucleotide amidase